MIRFSCTGCGTSFSVSEQYAGRKGRCRKCGAPLQAPFAEGAQERGPAASPPPSAGGSSVAEDLIGRALLGSIPPAKGRLTPFTQPPSAHAPSNGSGKAAVPTLSQRLPLRARRLLSDARLIRKTFRKSPHIRVRPLHGEPPEVYEVEYHVSSIYVGKGGKLTPRHKHLVEIQLTQDYPRMAPMCRMLTPIFHPNISETTICIGDHWVAGEHLADLIVRIAEMIAFQAYNIKSPLNAEAAMWVDLNTDKLPLDNRDLTPPMLVE